MRIRQRVVRRIA